LVDVLDELLNDMENGVLSLDALTLQDDRDEVDELVTGGNGGGEKG
jgi:hypothetical protein